MHMIPLWQQRPFIPSYISKFQFQHSLTILSNQTFLPSFPPDQFHAQTPMNSVRFAAVHASALLPGGSTDLHHHRHPSRLSFAVACQTLFQRRPPCRLSVRQLRSRAVSSTATNSTTARNGVFTVGDFMTRKENLQVVKATTTVDEALETLVEKRITGFPVIDDDWRLVGVVSDYDLLALDSISGGGQVDANVFPDVDSSWKTFNEIQRLLSKTNGKVVGDLMTPAPLVVCETTNLEDAVRLLLETKYRRLPVVDHDGRLVGIITRGNVVRAAIQIKHSNERYHN